MSKSIVTPVKNGVIATTGIGEGNYHQKIFYANNLYAKRLRFNAAYEVRGTMNHIQSGSIENIPLQKIEYDNRVLHNPRINYGFNLAYYTRGWSFDPDNTRPNQFYGIDPEQTIKLAVQQIYGTLISSTKYSTNTYLSVIYLEKYNKPSPSENDFWTGQGFQRPPSLSRKPSITQEQAQEFERDYVNVWTERNPQNRTDGRGMTPSVIMVDDNPMQNKPDTRSDVEGVTIKDSGVPQHVQDYPRVQLQYGLGLISADEIDYAVRLIQAAKLHWGVKEDLTTYDMNKGIPIGLTAINPFGYQPPKSNLTAFITGQAMARAAMKNKLLYVSREDGLGTGNYARAQPTAKGGELLPYWVAMERLRADASNLSYKLDEINQKELDVAATYPKLPEADEQKPTEIIDPESVSVVPIATGKVLQLEWKSGEVGHSEPMTSSCQTPVSNCDEFLHRWMRQKDHRKSDLVLDSYIPQTEIDAINGKYVRQGDYDGDQMLSSNSAKLNRAFYSVKHYVGSDVSNTPAWAKHLVSAKVIGSEEFLRLDRLDCLTHYEASKRRTYVRLANNGEMVWALIPMSPFEKNDLAREISESIDIETARQAASQNQSWKKLSKRRKR
jgi:hypothetical protein